MKPLTVTLSLKQTNIGRYEERVEFIFEDTQLKKFIIIRTLKVVVGNQAEHQALMPSAPYVPRVRITRQPMREIIEGIKPPALHAIPYIGGLPKAEIPARLVSTLSGSQATANTVAQVRNIFLPASLDTDTYGRYFKHLLWVEEYKMECVSKLLCIILLLITMLSGWISSDTISPMRVSHVITIITGRLFFFRSWIQN